MKQDNMMNISFARYSEANPGQFPTKAPFPVDIQFGLSNICNYTCLFCGEHRPGHTPPKVRFTDEMYEMMYRMLPLVEEAAFHENSEFFVDSQFISIAEECSRNNVTLSLNTNGSVLTDEQYRALAEYNGHLNIAVSLDATTPEVYRKIRGGSFEKVLANTQKMVQAVQGNFRYEGRKWCKTHTTAAFIIMQENKHQALDFVDIVDSMGFDRISFYRLHEGGEWVENRKNFVFDYKAQGPWNFKKEYNELMDTLQQRCNKLGILPWLPEKYPMGHTESTTQNLEHKTIEVPGTDVPICMKPWTGRIVIKASGDVHPCCHTWGVLGNIREFGFEGVWNSNKAQQLRRALKQHLFLPECRSMSCPIYRAALARGDAKLAETV